MHISDPELEPIQKWSLYCIWIIVKGIHVFAQILDYTLSNGRWSLKFKIPQDSFLYSRIFLQMNVYYHIMSYGKPFLNH